MNAMQQVPVGNALIPFLERAARAHDGDVWFRGLGVLEDTVLTDHRGVEVAMVDGEATLVTLDAAWFGGVLRVSATLLVPFAGGVTTLSGFVREATSKGVTLAGFAGGEAAVVAEVTDAPSAAEVTPEPIAAPAPTPAPEPAAASPWDRVAAMSQEIDDDDEFDIDDLEKNDVLIHPHVGRCRVWAVLGNDAVSVMLPSGKTRKLKLTMFRLRQQGGKREFLLERP